VATLSTRLIAVAFLQDRTFANGLNGSMAELYPFMISAAREFKQLAATVGEDQLTAPTPVRRIRRAGVVDSPSLLRSVAGGSCAQGAAAG
jgi:hypothetical protein